MNKKIRVAVIYKRSYIFLTGNHFDNTTYHLFMLALKRNKKLDVTYFPSEHSFDTSKLRGKFDIILIPNNNTDGTPDQLIGIDKLNIPVISKTGDPHLAKQYNQQSFHSKFKIDYYFGLQPKEYFHKFYPSNFEYKEIFWGVEASLFQNLKPFKDRIKHHILNSGNVGKSNLKSRLANKILNPKKSSWYFYNLRSKCNCLSYVDYAGTKNSKYINDDYVEYLSRYQASIAAATYWTPIKYAEIPASGCLTFMEMTDKNEGKRVLKYKDDETGIFINENNYKEKFEEFLNDPKNPKWEKIASAGRNFTLENYNNDNGATLLVELMESLL